MQSTHQILLTKVNGQYIVLENGTLEYCERMLQWYIAHNSFFNGEFSIREV